MNNNRRGAPLIPSMKTPKGFLIVGQSIKSRANEVGRIIGLMEPDRVIIDTKPANLRSTVEKLEKDWIFQYYKRVPHKKLRR